MRIGLDNASFSKGDFSIRNLSISIGEGLTVITGRSGSGKTILLSMLSGLTEPDEGSLIINGHRCDGPVENCGIVFQYPERQLFAETVLSDVAFALKRRNLPKDEISERSRIALRMVGVDERLWDESPFSLSGGEKRKVSIAGILVADPDILLLDEPTVGMDAASYENLMNLVLSISGSGKVVVMVTHDEEAASHADRVVVMDSGRIVNDGRSEDVVETDAIWLSERLGLGRIVDIDKLADGIMRRLR